MAGYKELKAWQANQECVKKLSALLDRLPKTVPVRIIGDQVFRSLVSVGANLAEGYESYEGKEYGRYSNIALRSAVETDHWLTTLLNLFSEFKDQIKPIESLNIETIKMIKGLIKSIEVKRNESP